MKRITLLLSALLFTSVQLCFSQNSTVNAGDYDRIALNVYIPDQAEKLSDISSKFLKDKVNQMLANYGLSGDNSSARFIVAPVVTILSKEITPTSPAMTIIDMQISLYIGDGINGVKFGGTSISVKGVGANETKAYNDAIKKMKTKDQSLQEFLESGKKKILEYYTDQCEFILSDAQNLSNVNDFEGAIYTLNQVPTVCKECYFKANKLAQQFYEKNQDRNCKIKLNQAENYWSANPNSQGANQAAELLNEIDPQTSCFESAKVLMKSIKSKIQNKLEADEKFQRKVELMELNNKAELEKERIKALRDISVAYAKSRTTTIIYKVRGWW